MTTTIVRLTRSSFEENLFSRMHFRGEWGKARRNEDRAKVRPPLCSLAPLPSCLFHLERILPTP